MHEFLDLLARSVADGTFVALVLSKPLAPAGQGPRKISVRPVQIRGELRWQWTLHSPRGEKHENLTAEQTLSQAAEMLRGEQGSTFAHAHLYTSTADYALRINRRGAAHLRTSAPSKQSADVAHDRRKQYLIPEGVPCPFLEAIGVMTPQGQVRAKRYSKFRQINRFLEFVEDIYGELPAVGPLRVVDFGCGKSYLTFALHHLLTQVHGRDVRIVGLDREPSVIETCRDVAQRLELAGLEFRVGDITTHQTDEPVDLAVSLHACDTATDDALARAIHWQARVILAVPCCQHELAAKLDCKPLLPLASHGILRERFAALATDALRACALEAAGYSTQVVEFIDLEHTAKNVLIRAVRRPSVPETAARARRQFHDLTALLGVPRLHLERLLSLADGASLLEPMSAGTQ
jgi:SAM-dependent methyltransferase